MLVLLIGQCFFDSELKWFPCHSQVLNMIVFELDLTCFLLFIIDQWLLLKLLIHGQVRDSIQDEALFTFLPRHHATLLIHHFLDECLHLGSFVLSKMVLIHNLIM